MPQAARLKPPPQIKQTTENNLQQHLKKLWFLGILAGILIALGMWLVQPTIWRVQHVQIIGVQRSDPQAIQQQTEQYTKAGFVWLDVDGLATALQQLAWITQVQVARSGLTRLHIQIQEHQPLAYWQDTESRQLVSQEAQIFTLSSPIDLELPVLIGDAAHLQAITKVYQTIQPHLQSASLELQQLSCQQRMSCQFELRNGLQVILGDIQQPVQTTSQPAWLSRFLRMLVVYSVIVDNPNRPPVRSLDLRYPHGIAVQAQSMAMAIEEEEHDGKR